MSRIPIIVSAICILGLTIFSLYIWQTLPEMERYPIHWNAAGEPDGFAGRNGVLGVLMIMPIMLGFTTVILWVVPKIEPLRANFEQSRKAYNIVWVVITLFFTVTGFVIASLYLGEGGFSVNDPLRWMAGGLSLLFAGIGNVMGKVRQNFMFGIRTPWTLSSELSWEKTHRIGGRLFVIAGLIGLGLTVLVPVAAFPFINIAILGIIGFVFVYSYRIWQGDPNKRK